MRRKKSCSLCSAANVVSSSSPIPYSRRSSSTYDVLTRARCRSPARCAGSGSAGSNRCAASSPHSRADAVARARATCRRPMRVSGLSVEPCQRPRCVCCDLAVPDQQQRARHRAPRALDERLTRADRSAFRCATGERSSRDAVRSEIGAAPRSDPLDPCDRDRCGARPLACAAVVRGCEIFNVSRRRSRAPLAAIGRTATLALRIRSASRGRRRLPVRERQ